MDMLTSSPSTKERLWTRLNGQSVAHPFDWLTYSKVRCGRHTGGPPHAVPLLMGIQAHQSRKKGNNGVNTMQPRESFCATRAFSKVKSGKYEI